ncbi:hypothetical protein CDL12_16064 [Handroanthus impetiginosus]|uniref:TTF-type domain-containing protein n=1 Tax=Handroanthus impetiginosus TaxID=429701 RepID=A0A2G9H1E0_9LAMI|nr:hypothetical protein CDL12_16064 [Handroanthus impetiginosus]
MEKYFKRKLKVLEKSSVIEESSQECSKRNREVINFENLPSDPGLRKKIIDYHPNDRDEIRRWYIQKKPCQPSNHTFPQRDIGGVMRRFNPDWFKQFENWLEYSIEKDAAFCLACYLFRPEIGKQAGGDSFVIDGFRAWNKKERLQVHIGGPNSAHNKALKMCEDLMVQNQHVDVAFTRHSDEKRLQYRTHLNASIDCVRFLLRQGLAFRGHDESEESKNQGNFLELLRFLGDHNGTIHDVLQSAPKNLKLTHSDIQKDIVNAAAKETINAIISDLGDELFAILLDESRDISMKEQMAVAFRYVNKKGSVVECFIGIVHVSETTSLSLKLAVESLFSKYGLSLQKIRGQGYDGASNMQGQYNGLKTLILKENTSAFYIHCFAHQLQLALVTVAKNHVEICLFFNLVNSLLNVVGASCKRRDILRQKQLDKISEELGKYEISSGQGLNQETTLKRPSDTRWGSHYGTLSSLLDMFSPVTDLLEFIMEDGVNAEHRAEASSLLDAILSFDFVFKLHLMWKVLGITNELSQALQRKDQDIVNAMKLVKISKEQLQNMRDVKWDSLLTQVFSFCEKVKVDIPDMNDLYARGKSRRKVSEVTYLHHYRVELFYTVIDMQLQELNDRFNEVNTELLSCVACLNPSNSFVAFDKQKLIRMAEFYPLEFSSVDRLVLDSQLDTYIIDMRSSDEFLKVTGIVSLAEKLVEKKKDVVYPLIYLLIKLALILPVATATVERAFSAMKIVKNRLRNRMGDQFMNDCLVTYIEKDVFNSISNESIMTRFQNMKNRRGQL